MTGKSRLGKMSIFMREYARALPTITLASATRTVMGWRIAKTIGFIRGGLNREGDAVSAEGRASRLPRISSHRCGWLGEKPSSRIHLTAIITGEQSLSTGNGGKSEPSSHVKVEKTVLAFGLGSDQGSGAARAHDQLVPYTRFGVRRRLFRLLDQDFAGRVEDDLERLLVGSHPFDPEGFLVAFRRRFDF